LAAQGHGEAGIALMHQGLAAIRAMEQRQRHCRYGVPCSPRRMGGSGRLRRGCACWPRRWLM
jgi:hypothetical protein